MRDRLLGGGYAGSVTLLAEAGDVFNSGDVMSNGGDSCETCTYAGSGGTVEMSGLTITQTGVLSLEAGVGRYGRGGYVTMAGLAISNEGPITSIGSSHTTTVNRASSGGGGWIEIRAADVFNSGRIETRSGSATASGAGVRADVARSGTIEMIGQTVTNEGALISTQGHGESDEWDANCAVPLTSVRLYGQTILNSGDIDADGGSATGATDADGCNGGNVELVGEEVINEGRVFANGGNMTVVGSGHPSGGVGGSVLVVGDNTADIQCNGGTVTVSGEPSAAGGGEIHITGDNSGCLEVAGGTLGEIVVDGTDTSSCE